MSEMQTDIAIVGGGIAGLTCAYRLSRLQPATQITVFEALDHLGGRVESGRLGGFAVEYGPIRIEPELQPRVCQLLTDVEVPLTSAIQYPPNNGMEPNDMLLRAAEHQAIAAGHVAGLGASMALLQYALEVILQGQWDLLQDCWETPGREEAKMRLLSEGHFRGVPFYAQVRVPDGW